MDIGSLLLLLALFIVVGAFIASPLRVRQGAAGLSQRDHEISELLAERERVLESLDELDLDNVMGKVPEEIYDFQREQLVKRGAEVLRLLDERMPGTAEAVMTVGEDDPLETMIAARKAGVKPAQAARQAATDTMVAAPAPAGNFCPSCGAKLEAGDRFCANCGAKL